MVWYSSDGLGVRGWAVRRGGGFISRLYLAFNYLGCFLDDRMGGGGELLYKCTVAPIMAPV